MFLGNICPNSVTYLLLYARLLDLNFLRIHWFTLFIVLCLARCRCFRFQMLGISETINKWWTNTIVVSRETGCDIVTPWPCLGSVGLCCGSVGLTVIYMRGDVVGWGRLAVNCLACCLDNSRGIAAALSRSLYGVVWRMLQIMLIVACAGGQ